MKVLVDSSVWIDFFRNGNDDLLRLLDSGSVVINDLIYFEIAPQLEISKNTKVLELLKNQIAQPMTIDFSQLYDMRLICIKNGINGTGAVDLMIAQYAVQHDLTLFSLDKHFGLMANVLPLKVLKNNF